MEYKKLKWVKLKKGQENLERLMKEACPLNNDNDDNMDAEEQPTSAAGA